MSQAGFFEQKRRSPGGFVLIVAAHGALLGALILVKGPPIAPPDRPLSTYNVPIPPNPEPIPPEPRLEPRPQQPTTIDLIPPRIPLPPQPDWNIDRTPTPPQPPFSGEGTSAEPVRPADPPPTPSVRRGAEIDQRFASAFQPPYPLSEQRAERSGTVRIRVTIGTDGRVTAIERVSATNDAFWEVAERQARTRWRFRPATVDGRPVESTKLMTLHFRIEDA